MHLSKLITTALLSLGLITSVASTASAQNIGDLSLRLEPGMAIPTWSPQDDRFLPGLDLSAKVGISLTPWLDFGPAISELILPSNVQGIDAGTATFLGGYARLLRPHNNTSTGIAAVSPWVDSTLSYVRTGDLDRLGWSGAIGAEWPVDTDRDIWVGPFVEGKNVFEPNHIGFNSNDDKTLIIGLSFEFGPRKAKTDILHPCPVCQNQTIVVQAPAPTTVAQSEVRVEYRETIQFAWDSFKLDDAATKQLNDVVAQIKSASSYDAIEVEGYASSEGQLEHNKTLASNRAKAVRAFLVASGLPQEKVSSTGFGITNPVAPNKTVAGRVQNRRASFVVKFVVISKGGK